jgi:hypothetical protein
MSANNDLLPVLRDLASRIKREERAELDKCLDQEIGIIRSKDEKAAEFEAAWLDALLKAGDEKAFEWLWGGRLH